jgi:hypothetical protein
VSTDQSERRRGTRTLPSEHGIFLAEPTRRTLVFPAVEAPRARRIPTPPLLPAYRLPPSSLLDERPSERPTLRTLPPVDEAGPRGSTSNAQVIELSASALDSDPSLLDLGLGRDLGRGRGRDADHELDLDAARAGRFERVRGWRSRARGPRRFVGYVALATLGAGALLAVSVVASAEPFGTASLVERVTGVSDGLHGGGRAPREAASEHTPLVLRAARDARVPAGACAMAGASRVLAKRARLGPGLDVSVLDGGFGVGFASGIDEALGLRLDGTPLRVADRMRVHAPSGVRHVAVDAGHGDDDAIDLRVDADDARTVVPDGGELPAFRVTAAGGWIQVVGGGLATGRVLWPVPGGAGASASASASASAGAKGKAVAAARVKAKGDAIVEAMMAARARAEAQGATRTRDGFVRLGNVRATTAPAPALPIDVRATTREEGGVVVALRRPSALWLGLVDGRFAAEGPLLALTRPGAVIGMPSVAPWGSGGVVAWAERPAGDHEWLVMVASFAVESANANANANANAPTVREIGAGMSPSIAMLPDGDLLLAYAVGVSGSHRVVVRRLGHDLEPRGEPIMVSPDELNAGQPATAVGHDGRAVVAFFSVEHGRPSSVLATPLACAIGL